MVYYVKHNTKYIVLLIFCTAAFSVIFACALLAAISLGDSVSVPINKTYYFLYVDGDMGVEASATSTSLSGGAGYIYSYAGREYVVIAAYEDELSALTVAGRIKETGVLALSANNINVKSSLADSLKEYISVLTSLATELYNCANGYDGGDINHARLVLSLSAVEDALLSAFNKTEENLKGYSSFADEQVVSALAVIESAVSSSSPSSDIRYAQVALCAAVLSYAD